MNIIKRFFRNIIPSKNENTIVEEQKLGGFDIDDHTVTNVTPVELEEDISEIVKIEPSAPKPAKKSPGRPKGSTSKKTPSKKTPAKKTPSKKA